MDEQGYLKYNHLFTEKGRGTTALHFFECCETATRLFEMEESPRVRTPGGFFRSGPKCIRAWVDRKSENYPCSASRNLSFNFEK